MQPSDRVRFIQRIASALQETSRVDQELVLSQFEVEMPFGNYPSEYARLLSALKDASDSALTELHRHCFPNAGDVEVSTEARPGLWEAGTFRLFISHTSAHKQQAGNLRTQLGRWDVDAFVAHDTIEPTREWQDEIETALQTCDALCAFLTPDFVNSRWCDQEVGFVVGRGVLVVALKLGADPHGFIGKYQALPMPTNASGAYVVADRLFTALAKNAQTGAAMAPAVVRRYVASGSFDDTRAVFPLLQAIPADAWTSSMIEQVERAAIENSQVRHANLPGGRPVPEAAEDLLRSVRGEPETPADDDIPF